MFRSEQRKATTRQVILYTKVQMLGYVNENHYKDALVANVNLDE